MPVVPERPAEWPAFGNAVTRCLGRTVLQIAGWRMIGQLPTHKKLIMAVAPHTSNWDFFVGLFALFGIGARLHWIGKHTIFRWPVRGLLLRLGGIPVNRTLAQSTVEQTVDRFRQEKALIVVMTPEGTRRKVDKLKTGFLRIAAGARIPILLVGFDYAKKEICLGELFHPSNDLAADEKMVRDYFRQFTGKYPELY